MNSLDFLIKILEKYINHTALSDGFGVYFIKEQVGRIRSMKIEIYPNDHNPPHFHVKSNDSSIDACFLIEDCTLLKGKINSNDFKRIKAFYNGTKCKELMKEMWNKSKSGDKKIT